jgi:hypothetical protein
MKGEFIDAGVPVARIKSWTSPRKIWPHSANQVRPHVLIRKYLKLKENIHKSSNHIFLLLC